MSKTEKPIFTLNKREGETTSREDETASKIEVIKNLIFGEQIQAYDSEFEKLKEDILGKKKVLETLMEEVRTDLENAITDMSTDVNIRITELEENLENRIELLQAGTVDKEMLGKMFLEMGKKLSK